MAAIAVVYGEEMTEQTHTGDTNFVDALKIAAAGWTANAVYMLIVTAQVNGSNTGALFDFRVTAGGTLITGSQRVVEPAQGTTQKDSYAFATKYTVPGSAEDVIFQIKTRDAGNTVKADTIVMAAVRLDADLTEGADWFFVEDTTNTQLTTTHVDFALKTFTPGNNNDDWMVVGLAQWAVDSAAVNAEARLRLDGSEASPTDDAPFISEEGEDLAEQKVVGFMRVFTLSNSSHTFAMQMRDDATGVNNHLRTAIFGLRLNAFEDHSFDWTEPEQTFASLNVWEEMKDMAFTPTRTGDFFILSFAANDRGGTPGSIRTQLAGTTIPTGADVQWDARGYDLDDENPLGLHVVKVNLADSLQDVDFDGRVGSVLHPIEDKSIAIFSVELAAAGGPQTITPGAVAISMSAVSPSIAGSGAAPITPGAVAIPVSAVAPSLAGSGVAPITPGAVAIPVSAVAPAIAGSGSAPITPGAVAIPVSAVAPALAGSGPAPIIPGPVAIPVSAVAPALAGSGAATMSPGPVSMALAVVAPSIAKAGGPQTLSPSATAIILAGVAPSISGTGTATISPAALAILISGVGPSIAALPGPVDGPTQAVLADDGINSAVLADDGINSAVLADDGINTASITNPG